MSTWKRRSRTALKNSDHAHLLACTSKWSSSTIGSIREEHERRGPSAKLRLYFGGGGKRGNKNSKVPPTPTSMKSPSRTSYTEFTAQALIPRFYLPFQMNERWNAVHTWHLQLVSFIRNITHSTHIVTFPITASSSSSFVSAMDNPNHQHSEHTAKNRQYATHFPYPSFKS